MTTFYLGYSFLFKLNVFYLQSYRFFLSVLIEVAKASKFGRIINNGYQSKIMRNLQKWELLPASQHFTPSLVPLSRPVNHSLIIYKKEEQLGSEILKMHQGNRHFRGSTKDTEFSAPQDRDCIMFTVDYPVPSTRPGMIQLVHSQYSLSK